MTKRDMSDRTGIGRRTFLRRALGAGAVTAGAGLALGSRTARAQGSGEVVVCTWGGTYTEAQRKFFFDPFEKETGIRVRTVGVPDIAKIRAMVQARAVEWDLVDAEGQMMLRLAADDMLERADFSVIPRGDLLPAAASDWGIGSVAYALLARLEQPEVPGRPPAPHLEGLLRHEGLPGPARHVRPAGARARVRPPGRRRRAGRALSARRRPRVPVPREPEGRRERLVQEPGPDPDAPPRGRGGHGRGVQRPADRPQEGRGRRRLDVRQRRVDAVVLDRAEGRQEPRGGHAAHGPLHAARARGRSSPSCSRTACRIAWPTRRCRRRRWPSCRRRPATSSARSRSTAAWWAKNIDAVLKRWLTFLG